MFKAFDSTKLLQGDSMVQLMDDTEQQLYQRHTRIAREIAPIEYEFTNDRALLHQYYQLREVMYRKIYHTEDFVGKEDVHDKISHILIARQGKLCVGGARLTVREGDEDFQLPMECGEFNIKELAETADFCKYRHCEISRFAILSDKFEKEVMQEMVKLLIGKMADLNVNYLFIKANLPMARNWRKMGTVNGLTENHIFQNIDVPENPIHPGMKWYLLRINVVPVVAPAVVSEAQLAVVEQ